MKTIVQETTLVKTATGNYATDDDMRHLLMKVFPESTWLSGLPTVREFFAAIINHYKERLSEGRKRFAMPKFDIHAVRRELMFLENLDASVTTIHSRDMTLWSLFQEAKHEVVAHSPKVGNVPAKNLAAFRYRIAQYVYVIRNARKVAE